jgi:hypothetical protein
VARSAVGTEGRGLEEDWALSPSATVAEVGHE